MLLFSVFRVKSVFVLIICRFSYQFLVELAFQFYYWLELAFSCVFILTFKGHADSYLRFV